MLASNDIALGGIVCEVVVDAGFVDEVVEDEDDDAEEEEAAAEEEETLLGGTETELTPIEVVAAEERALEGMDDVMFGG